MSRRDPRGERGAVALEVALVIPIFLVLVFGLIDVGLGIFQTSQASSAAADGVRVAMTHETSADVTNSANFQLIASAVHARLPSQKVDTLTVTCLTPAGVTEACSLAVDGTDRIKVAVSWKFHPVSFVGSALPVQNISSSSTVVIVGSPK